VGGFGKFDESVGVWAAASSRTRLRGTFGLSVMGSQSLVHIFVAVADRDPELAAAPQRVVDGNGRDLRRSVRAGRILWRGAGDGWASAIRYRGAGSEFVFGAAAGGGGSVTSTASTPAGASAPPDCDLERRARTPAGQPPGRQRYKSEHDDTRGLLHTGLQVVE
jgi:hypothetical protein